MSARTSTAIAWSGALLALLISIAAEADARGRGGGGGFRGGGGIRGGGMSSMSRGSDFGRGSYDRGSGGYRSGGTFSRDGSYSKPSGLDNKPSRLDGGGSSGTNWDSMTRVPRGSSGTATQLPSERPGAGGGGTATQLPSSRPGSGYATQLPAQRPGSGGGTQLPAKPPGENVSRPDCPKCSDGWDGWVDHPIAAGIAIGAVAGYRAAIGMTYYSLPYDCPPYYWESVHYYYCDGIYYEPQFEGDTIVYVTVPDHSGGKQQPAK